MMGVKNILSDRDMLELNRINRQQKFDIEEIDNCISDHIIRDGKGDMIAYGIIKNFAEATILLDLDRSKRTKIKALTELVELGEIIARNNNISQIHAFVKEPLLATTYVKHFGYRRVNDIPLLKDIT